jgi:HAD superfamily hydrolase (TIGR01490 family)
MTDATKVAAFFDLDGTITRINTDWQAATAGYRAGHYSLWVGIRGTWATILYKLGLRSPAYVKLGFVEAGYGGRREEEALAFAKDLYQSRLRGEIYQEALDALAELKAQNVDTYIVSASFYTSIVPFFEEWGFDGYFATMVEVGEDGIYTGRPVLPVQCGEQKAQTIRELAEQRGYDLDRCHAFGDSMDDRYMLEAVGHPNAVNPRSKLCKIAHDKGWRIREWKRTLAGAGHQG